MIAASKKKRKLEGGNPPLLIILSLIAVIAMTTLVEDLPTTISLTALIIQGLDTDEK